MVELNQCTPTREQMWLLQTALQQGNPARQAWQEWRTRVDLDDVDLPSYHLLPLVYENLARLGIENELLGRLKGIYRHNWSKNHMLLYQAQRVVTQLAAVDIRTMFLHGTAMATGYYQDEGTRVMSAIDILVPQAQFYDAITQLERDTWQLSSCSHDELRWFHQHQLRSVFTFHRGQVELNLHTRLLPLVRQEEAQIWHNAHCQSRHGQPMYLLDPTQQLFHTCVHGMTWSNGYLTWIPDALTILTLADSAGTETDTEARIDWPTLIQQAEATRKILPLRNTLRFLVEEFQAPIPAVVLEQLAVMPVTFAEKVEYRLLGTEATTVGNKRKRILIAACRYQTLRRPTAAPLRLSLTAWVPYLFHRWRLDHWWQWPKQFIVKSIGIATQGHMQSR